MPFDRPAEIALPDVEDEAGGPVDMGLLEFRRVQVYVVEMAIGAGECGRADRPVPGRHIHIGPAEGQFIDAIGRELADRIDDIDAVVGGTRANPVRRGRNMDEFRRPLRMQKRRPRKQPESRACAAHAPRRAPTPIWNYAEVNILSNSYYSFVNRI
jgi:hypothetical protein